MQSVWYHVSAFPLYLKLLFMHLEGRIFFPSPPAYEKLASKIVAKADLLLAKPPATGEVAPPPPPANEIGHKRKANQREQSVDCWILMNRKAAGSVLGHKGLLAKPGPAPTVHLFSPSEGAPPT